MRSAEIDLHIDRVFTWKSFITRKPLKQSKKHFGKYTQFSTLSKFGRFSIQPDLRRLMEAGIYNLWINLVAGLNVVPASNMGPTVFHPQSISSNIASVFIMVVALEGGIMLCIFTLEIFIGYCARVYEMCARVRRRKTKIKCAKGNPPIFEVTGM